MREAGPVEIPETLAGGGCSDGALPLDRAVEEIAAELIAAAPGMRRVARAGGFFENTNARTEFSEYLKDLLIAALSKAHRARGGTATETPQAENGDVYAQFRGVTRRSDLVPYSVISFATHALLSQEAQALTQGAITEPALVLHPGEGEDGFLTASEAATLRLDADWVLLSACNTAAGDAEDAEGLSGLARAFFFAGAKALMVSHWPVDDRAARALMTETMRLGRAGQVSRAEALRQATLAVMNHPNHDYRHPLYWAPFVVVGESRP